MLRAPPHMPRSTAWSSWQEWSWVKNSLASDDAEVRASAFRRVQTWRSRSMVPLAVDATASLLQVVARDHQYAARSVSSSLYSSPAVAENELRLAYAMVLLRFVNGVSDAAQQHTFAKSVSQLSQSLGLERLLVDIRHAATHNKLPSLQTLRQGAASAMAWLSTKYWIPQSEALQDTSLFVTDALIRYKKAASSAPNPADDTESNPLDELESVTQRIAPGSPEVHRELVRSLLAHGKGAHALLLKLPKTKAAPSASNVAVVMTKLAQIWSPALSLFDRFYSDFMTHLVLALSQLLLQWEDQRQKEQELGSSDASSGRTSWLQAVTMGWLELLLERLGSVRGAYAEEIALPDDSDEDSASNTQRKRKKRKQSSTSNDLSMMSLDSLLVSRCLLPVLLTQPSVTATRILDALLDAMSKSERSFRGSALTGSYNDSYTDSVLQWCVSPGGRERLQALSKTLRGALVGKEDVKTDSSLLNEMESTVRRLRRSQEATRHSKTEAKAAQSLPKVVPCAWSEAVDWSPVAIGRTLGTEPSEEAGTEAQDTADALALVLDPADVRTVSLDGSGPDGLPPARLNLSGERETARRTHSVAMLNPDADSSERRGNEAKQQDWLEPLCDFVPQSPRFMNAEELADFALAVTDGGQKESEVLERFIAQASADVAKWF